MQADDGADRYPVVQGRVQVACCLVLRAICPVCGRDHCHLLTAADHLELPGERYWRSNVHGEPYFVRLREQTLASAQRDARTLAAQLHVPMWGWDDCALQ